MIYNRVMKAGPWASCPEGELLTDKELESYRLYHNCTDEWVETAKVKVKPEDKYFFFGSRFTSAYKLV